MAAACHPPVIPPDGKTLDDVAALFHAHGWQGTTNVVVDYADAGLCGGAKDYANWAELAALQSAPYRWQSISASQSYPLDLAALSGSQVQAESCGSLSTFAAKGYTRAWGLFAYPAGRYTYNSGDGAGTGNAQMDIVHNCFAFGRVYGSGVNRRSTLGPPWLIRALSPVGGKAAGSGGRYMGPSMIAGRVAAGIATDTWLVIQFYRFRSGAVPGDHNCLGPESTHFTTLNEEYCWEDFQAILGVIPSDAVVTDPATVACAWGRFPDAGPRPLCP